MLPTIATGNVGSALAGEYEVANSLRFDDGSTANLSKTLNSGGNRKTWTFSAWVKRSNLPSAAPVLFSSFVNTQNYGLIRFDSLGRINIVSKISDTNNINITTSALYRDVSSWYHFVIAVDTTQSTNTDRVKVYVNGVQITSFSTSTYPSQNYSSIFNYNITHYIGRYGGSTTGNFDGYMAEVVLIDGQQLTPTSFGESDEDTGIWKPKDVSDLTFGTNGFYLPFENSSALGQDDSGNGNNFTVNNLTSIDQTTDTCTNNFATMNTLTNNGTLSEGNLKVVTNTALNDLTTASTIHVSQGKWYVEFKCVSSTSGTNYNIGITSDPSENIRASEYAGQSADSYGVLGSNGNFYNNASSVSYMNTFTAGDIIAIALDLDNNYIYFSKNGTWQNSGDPESGSSGTGGKSITSASSQSSGVYAFAVGDATGSGSMTFEINYGNPTFTISSGNSDANGYGNFEYAVPSGYFALCTKNLAEHG